GRLSGIEPFRQNKPNLPVLKAAGRLISLRPCVPGSIRTSPDVPLIVPTPVPVLSPRISWPAPVSGCTFVICANQRSKAGRKGKEIMPVSSFGVPSCSAYSSPRQYGGLSMHGLQISTNKLNIINPNRNEKAADTSMQEKLRPSETQT